ncbi:MAG TPA: redoxin domain-containing protein [Humisphaera sp.]
MALGLGSGGVIPGGVIWGGTVWAGEIVKGAPADEPAGTKPEDKKAEDKKSADDKADAAKRDIEIKPGEAQPDTSKPDGEKKPTRRPIVIKPGDMKKPGGGNGPELLKPAGGPASKPATPASKPSVQVSAEVRAQLDKVRDAYKALKTLKVAGTITSDIDVNEQQVNERAQFEGAYEAPLKFRHRLLEASQAVGAAAKPQAKETMVVGGTGAKLYVFQPQYNYYYLADAPKERSDTAKYLGMTVAPLLEQQNLSLELALCGDASAELLANIDRIEKVDDVTIDGTACPALKITVEKMVAVTAAFDPKTNLLRRVVYDRKAYAEARKQQDVKKVLVTIDYTTTEPGADVKGEQFAWAPPVGARDVTSLADAGSADDDDAAGGGGPTELVGQPAPDFTLKGLDGQDVKLSDLKGSVVLLDFWATWCGPCRASLPHLDEIYKELGPKGLKAYAVDLREKPELVKSFVEKTKLSIPPLLDTDGKVAKSFKVGGIPQTVVVGKDGTIKAVVVGAGTHDKVRAAIEKELQ